MDGWSRRDAATHQAARHHAHASRAHHVPPFAHLLDEDVKQRYDVIVSASCCTATPCPVDVKRRMISGGALSQKGVLRGDRGRHVHHLKGVARAPGQRRQEVAPAFAPSSSVPKRATYAAASEVGTVWFKRSKPSRSRNHRDPEAASVHGGDLFTLGDMGYMDDDGYLFLTDRSANLIISGGVNIYPAEIDAVLLEHPAVRCRDSRRTDEEWSEAVKAVVEVREGITADGAARRRADGVLPRADRALQVPPFDRLRHRPPRFEERKDLPPPGPRPLLALVGPR